MKQKVFDILASLQTAHFPNGIYGQIKVQIDGSKITITVPFAVSTLTVSEEITSALSQGLDDAFDIDLKFEPTETRKSLAHQAKTVIAVASGKGGVGKSTVTTNLAAALAQLGHKVGVVDADIYGPSIPMMFGLQGEQVGSKDEKTMEPLRAYEVWLNSIGFLIPPDKASIWRGPMASRALTQIVTETNWPELDVMLIDMPPGTGDIQLTLSESIKCDGAVIVTTPQNIALADAEKGIQMFNKVSTPVLGIIENMSQFICTECGVKHQLFGTGGGERCASEHNVPLLAQLSLNGSMRARGDSGEPFSLNDTNLEYQKLALSLMMQLSKKTQQTILVN